MHTHKHSVVKKKGKVMMVKQVSLNIEYAYVLADMRP